MIPLRACSGRWRAAAGSVTEGYWCAEPLHRPSDGPPPRASSGRNLPRRIPQPPEKPRDVEPLALLQELRLGLLELHHAVDPPVEEGAGLGLALAGVLDEHRQRRGVDAHQD